MGGCDDKVIAPEAGADAQGHTAPTPTTIEVNARAFNDLASFDPMDFEDAKRGLIACEPELRIKGADGEIIFDQTVYGFIKGKAPASVNPSLWRQEKLNNIHGLFKVTDGIYQIRGYDVANMTIIEGKTGWILVDPLTSKQTAARALAFARKNLGDKPITAVVLTHSHVDHFGGILGVLSVEEAAMGKVPVIAPQGFMEESTSENIIGGVAMGRRTGFVYGKWLARNKRGHVGIGLGKQLAMGSMSILKPTIIVDRTPQELLVDGVQFVFQNVPDSEAPAELTFHLPEKKAFCGAELVSRNMHNIYTLRGAKVRDALAWSDYIDQALHLFGAAEIYFASHHWPIWGNKRVAEFLKQQRDMYKYIHDQTIRLASSGYTPPEIAEQLEMPESLRRVSSSRGYYGTLRHNARAVYQAYFGWFDANPAHLDPLPPTDAAKRYVELMGGADKVLASGYASFDRGEYRWVAELLNHLVFADPGNAEAKALLARTYDQLGYQSESGPWRDTYLTGAYELRHGKPKIKMNMANAKGLLEQTPIENLFDAVAVRLNGSRADGVDLTINIVFTDIGEKYLLWVENAVLHHRKGEVAVDADATLKITFSLYMKIVLGTIKIKDAVLSDELEVKGSKIDLIRFFALLDFPDTVFNIVEP